MSNSYLYERVIELAHTQGVIRPSDVEAQGLSRHHLSRLARDGKLVRLERGIYMHPDRNVTEHSAMVEVAAKNKNVVICLLSALQFHELTTQAPAKVWVALANNARIPRMSYPPLKVVRFSGLVLTEGVQTHNLEGIDVQITSVAKTVVDCFKFRNRVGLDVALEALRDAWQTKKMNMDELWHYAKICRMTNVMRPYLESLV